MSVDLRKIKKLIELVEESSISELEVRDGEETIRIVRPSVDGRGNERGHGAGQTIGSAVTGAAGASVSGERSSAPTQRAARSATIDVRSPMAGTFYRAPAPGERAFVEPGQRVEAGDVLCIIESMKMMNEITADRPGVCVAVVARDGEAVGSGQVLLRFET